MLDRKIYNLMKRKYGDVGSWAVWCPQTDKNAPKSNMGNLDWTKDEDGLCSVLNPEFVFVGLNLSDSHGKYSDANTPWVNFHSGNPHGNSFKPRFALKDTSFWGAYMTDLIKGVKETDSKKVVSKLKKDSALLERSMKEFEREISHLGGKPVLVALGKAVGKFLKPLELEGKYVVKELPHYSSRINKEQYRAEVSKTIGKYINKTSVPTVGRMRGK